MRTSSAASLIPASSRWLRDYAEPPQAARMKCKTMNRLYVVETMPTVTGFKAEHRLALKPSEIAPLQRLWRRPSARAAPAPSCTGRAGKFLTAVAADLKANAGKCVVIPGEQQSADVHLAAIAHQPGSGHCRQDGGLHRDRESDAVDQGRTLKSLVADMNAGKVKWLVMLGVNPVYSRAGGSATSTQALDKVPRHASIWAPMSMRPR